VGLEELSLRLAAFLQRSRVNGPGVRAVVWVQGCARHCLGCCNPGFLDPASGEDVTVAELLSRIASAEGLGGVTLSGGEPFDQAAPLAEFCRQVRREGLTVVCFSGYELPELQQGLMPGHAALLNEIDLLVAGPYNVMRPCSTPLRASGNQSLHFLTDRLRPQDLQGLPRVEVTVRGGVVEFSGFEPGLALALRSRGGFVPQ